MQTCIRWSLDSRRVMDEGTMPVPCFEVTTSVSPSRRSACSSGVQFMPWQHSIGYHSCARGSRDHQSQEKDKPGPHGDLVGLSAHPASPQFHELLLDRIVPTNSTEDNALPPRPGHWANFLMLLGAQAQAGGLSPSICRAISHHSAGGMRSWRSGHGQCVRPASSACRRDRAGRPAGGRPARQVSLSGSRGAVPLGVPSPAKVSFSTLASACLRRRSQCSFSASPRS